MKRWLSIVLAVFMVFAVLACESDDDKKAKKQGPTITNNVIDLNGGGATTGDGGDGGDIRIRWSGYQGVQFVKEGTVDTSFTLPDYTNVVDLGDNGWVVDVDINVASYSAGEPADGEYHMHDDDITIYARVTGTDVPVTGIKVNRGATLTLPLNMDSDNWFGVNMGSSCLDMAALMLPNDLVVNGMLTVENLTTGTNCSAGDDPEQRLHVGNISDANARDSGAIWIDPNRVYIGDRGDVLADGVPAPATSGERGGDGGMIFILGLHGLFSDGTISATGAAGDGLGGDGGNGGLYGSYYSYNYGYYYNGGAFLVGGSVVNTGSIDVSGGQGTYGGYGTTAMLGGYVNTWNAGDLIANGGAGAGTLSYGGYGGYAIMGTYMGNLFNRGDLSAKGGDGASGGAAGGDIWLEAAYGDYFGDVINSGRINVSGGSATTSGWGSNAGDVDIYATGGGIRNSGRILGYGGEGVGTGYYGGDGADVSFRTWVGEPDYPNNGVEATRNPGNIVIANDILISGGYGPGGGGEGGNLQARDPDEEDVDDEMKYNAMLKFVGFSDGVLLNGGDGADGGDGGFFRTRIFAAEIFQDSMQPAGPFIANVKIEVDGGQGTAGSGGNADRITVEIRSEDDTYNKHTALINNAKLSAVGGSGTTSGGEGGGISLAKFYRSVNNGTMTVDGGNGGTDVAGQAGNIRIGSMYNSTNNGVLSADAGDSTGSATGADGGLVKIVSGDFTRNNGTIRARGGDGTVDGGWGGKVNLFSMAGKNKNKGTISVVGGRPDPDNDMVGFIYFDLVDVTPKDGTLGF